MVFKGKPETRTEYNDMEPLLSNGIAKISSAEKLLDQPCVLLEIREKANPDDIMASYWISERNGLVLKSVIESPGATITETKVTELKLDEEIPDSKFEYKPAGNAQIIENK
jgi:outer membrane lipoprotein-sorting protein